MLNFLEDTELISIEFIPPAPVAAEIIHLIKSIPCDEIIHFIIFD